LKSKGPLLVVAAALLAATLGLAASVAWFGGAPALAGTPLGQWLLARWAGAHSPRIGSRVAPFRLPDRQGRAVLMPPPGRAVLINYWASWCEPCLREMPLLDHLAARQVAGGPQVVGIALDAPAAVEGFLARTPVRFPILIEAPGPKDSSVRLGNAPGILPFTVLVDDQGRLRDWRIGPFADAGELEAFANAAR
jgi:thiol-disulfide isomerase/thioredoxin